MKFFCRIFIRHSYLNLKLNYNEMNGLKRKLMDLVFQIAYNKLFKKIKGSLKLNVILSPVF